LIRIPHGQARRAAFTIALLLAFAVLAGIVFAGDASALDSWIRDFVHSWAFAGLTNTMLIVTTLGSVAVLGVLAVLVIIAFHLARQRDSVRVLAWTMGGAILLDV
jgi:hypothetical protein